MGCARHDAAAVLLQLERQPNRHRVFNARAAVDPRGVRVALAGAVNVAHTHAAEHGHVQRLHHPAGGQPQTLCLTEPFQYTKYASFQNVSDPAAQIVSVEIANNPIAPKPCP